MTNQFYSAKVRYTKQMQNGTFKRVNEPYLFVAESFTDAEATIYQEVGEYVKGEFSVTAIKKEKIEKFINPDVEGRIWKTTVSCEIWNDDGETKKKTKLIYAVIADSAKEAYEITEEEISYFVSYENVQVVGVVLTDFEDYFPAKVVEVEDGVSTSLKPIKEILSENRISEETLKPLNADSDEDEDDDEDLEMIPVSRNADDEDDEEYDDEIVEDNAIEQ